MRLLDHPRWCLAAILAVALAVRLVAGAWWQQRLPAGQKFAFGDSESYWQLGQTIAHGRPFAYGPDRLQVFRTPGYPALLAPLFWFSDEPPVMAARALSAVLSTAAVALAAALAWQLFDHRAALLAAALAAIAPESVALGVFVLSEAPFAPLMMVQLLFWALACAAPSFRKALGWSLASGVCAGLATLMRPSWLLFIPFAAAVQLLYLGVVGIATRGTHFSAKALNLAKESQGTAPPLTLWNSAALALVMLVGLTLTMSPWWLRNYRVTGRFVPTTLQVGASLYDGLSPTATGASDMRFVGAFVAEQRAEDARLGDSARGLFEERLDERMRSAAVDWARQNPSRVLNLAIVKLGRMWSPLPNASEFQSRGLRLILAATYLPILLAALVGAWKFAGRGWPYFLCLVPAIYLTCLHVIFVSSIRYRQPAMLPLIVLAAAAPFHGTGRQGDRETGGQSRGQCRKRMTNDE